MLICAICILEYGELVHWSDQTALAKQYQASRHRHMNLNQWHLVYVSFLIIPVCVSCVYGRLCGSENVYFFVRWKTKMVYIQQRTERADACRLRQHHNPTHCHGRRQRRDHKIVFVSLILKYSLHSWHVWTWEHETNFSAYLTKKAIDSAALPCNINSMHFDIHWNKWKIGSLICINFYFTIVILLSPPHTKCKLVFPDDNRRNGKQQSGHMMPRQRLPWVVRQFIDEDATDVYLARSF